MITFKLGQIVQRTDLNGDKVTRELSTVEDIDYHSDFQNKGYKYEVIKDVVIKPRLYTGEAVCTSCES